MATTVRSATLKVTLKEEIVLNGNRQDSENVKRISDINEIFKQIVTCTTDRNELFAAIGSGTDRGSFLEANIRYIRITNLDDTYHVNLFFKNESNDEFAVKLDYGQSFIYNADLSGGVVDTMVAASGAVDVTSLVDLVSINAIAHTAAVDVEIFIAST